MQCRATCMHIKHICGSGFHVFKDTGTSKCIKYKSTIGSIGIQFYTCEIYKTFTAVQIGFFFFFCLCYFTFSLQLDIC